MLRQRTTTKKVKQALFHDYICQLVCINIKTKFFLIFFFCYPEANKTIPIFIIEILLLFVPILTRQKSSIL